MISLYFRPDNTRRNRPAPCTFVRVYDSPSEYASPIAYFTRSRKTRRSKWAVSVSLAGHNSKPVPEFREYVRAICDAADSYQWPADD